MSRPASSSSITLGGIVIVVLVAILSSTISGTNLQWVWIPLVVVVGLWTADAMNKRKGGGGRARGGSRATGRYRR